MHASHTDTAAITPHADKGQRLAVLAQALYLGNLLVAPGLAFAVLLWLWFKHKDSAPYWLASTWPRPPSSAWSAGA